MPPSIPGFFNVLADRPLDQPGLPQACRLDHARCRPVAEQPDPDPAELIRTLTELAVGFWRMRRGIDRSGVSTDRDRQLQQAERIEAALEETGLRWQSYDNQRYVEGMAVRVLAFQHRPGIIGERISETIAPAIFWRNRLLCRAEIIVDHDQTAPAANDAPVPGDASDQGTKP